MAHSPRHHLGGTNGPILAIVVLCSGCGSPAPTDVAPAQGPGVSVRRAPLSQQVYPLKDAVCTGDDLAQLALLADPRFPDYHYPRVPVALIYHAMRVWGRDCPFAVTDEAGAQARDEEGLCLRIITSNAEYRKRSRITTGQLLSPSEVGVHVVTWGDSVWGSEYASTHFGKYVLLMGELGIPSDQPLMVEPGRNNVLEDVIVDHAWNVHLADENDWAAPGLAKYLTARQWHNRFGQLVSFDDLAYSLIKRPFGQGACNGTHVLYALVALLDAHQQAPILTDSAVQAAKRRLTECGQLLTRTQHSDGSWGNDWHDAKASANYPTELMAGLRVDRVIATGHHLEWLCLCPPEFRPDDLALARAALYLKRTLPGLRVALKEDNMHWYLPISHAVRGLLLAHGHRWANRAYLQTPVSGAKPAS